MRSCLFVMSLGLLFASTQPARAQVIIQKILDDNPKGFWILNDAPGVPATATDSSVNAFHGAYGPGVTPQGTAGPSWVPPAGLVANFADGRINFPTPLNLGASGYTIEAWINPSLSSLQTTTRIVASSGGGFDGYGFGTAEGGNLVFTSFSVKDYFTTGVRLKPNEWQYVGVVLDANNAANFYVNGALVQTVAGGLLGTKPPTGNFTIGNQSPGVLGANEPYIGGLAGISVYDKALTSAQILAQFNAAAVPEPPSLLLSGLVALGAGCILRQRRRKAGSSVPR